MRIKVTQAPHEWHSKITCSFLITRVCIVNADRSLYVCISDREIVVIVICVDDNIAWDNTLDEVEHIKGLLR